MQYGKIYSNAIKSNRPRFLRATATKFRKMAEALETKADQLPVTRPMSATKSLSQVIPLLKADPTSPARALALQTGLSVATCAKWRKRFLEVEGLPSPKKGRPCKSVQS